MFVPYKSSADEMAAQQEIVAYAERRREELEEAIGKLYDVEGEARSNLFWIQFWDLVDDPGFFAFRFESTVLHDVSGPCLSDWVADCWIHESPSEVLIPVGPHDAAAKYAAHSAVFCGRCARRQEA